MSAFRPETTHAIPLTARRSRPLEGGPNFSLGNRAYRALWAVAWFAPASWTPPFLRSWRLFALRPFGARVARGARVYSSVRIRDPRHLTLDAYACLGPRVDCYAMAPISLGRYAIASQDAVLCAGTHDIDDPGFQLTTKPIVIGVRAWVAAGAFVGPGVSIGEGAVLGARAVAFTNIAPSTVCVGNPARRLKERSRHQPTQDSSRKWVNVRGHGTRTPIDASFRPSRCRYMGDKPAELIRTTTICEEYIQYKISKTTA
jgi:putative colanic acid biosynthesis acetyltransferase WcaF